MMDSELLLHCTVHLAPVIFSQPSRAPTTLPQSACAHDFKDLHLSVDGCIQYMTVINGAVFTTLICFRTFFFGKMHPVLARPAASLLAILYPVWWRKFPTRLVGQHIAMAARASSTASMMGSFNFKEFPTKAAKKLSSLSTRKSKLFCHIFFVIDSMCPTPSCSFLNS